MAGMFTESINVKVGSYYGHLFTLLVSERRTFIKVLISICQLAHSFLTPRAAQQDMLRVVKECLESTHVALNN